MILKSQYGNTLPKLSKSGKSFREKWGELTKWNGEKGKVRKPFITLKKRGGVESYPVKDYLMIFGITFVILLGMLVFM